MTEATSSELFTAMSNLLQEIKPKSVKWPDSQAESQIATAGLPAGSSPHDIFRRQAAIAAKATLDNLNRMEVVESLREVVKDLAERRRSRGLRNLEATLPEPTTVYTSRFGPAIAAYPLGGFADIIEQMVEDRVHATLVTLLLPHELASVGVNDQG